MDWRFCCLSFEVTQLGLVFVMWAHLEFEIKWISNINSMLKKTLAHTKLCWEVTLCFQNPNSFHVMFGGPTWQDFLINLSFDLYEMQGGDTCKRLKGKNEVDGAHDEDISSNDNWKREKKKNACSIEEAKVLKWVAWSLCSVGGTHRGGLMDGLGLFKAETKD